MKIHRRVLPSSFYIVFPTFLSLPLYFSRVHIPQLPRGERAVTRTCVSRHARSVIFDRLPSVPLRRLFLRLPLRLASRPRRGRHGRRGKSRTHGFLLLSVGLLRVLSNVVQTMDPRQQ